jgi:hypothetical protein
MIMLVAVTATSGAVSVSPDTAATLRADISPYLECDRRFNDARIKLEAEFAELYTSSPVGEENVKAHERNLERNEIESRDLIKKSALDCKLDESFAKFEAKIKSLNPKYSDRQLRKFAWNLFNSIREIDRSLHRYEAGQYVLPVAPPIKKSSR